MNYACLDKDKIIFFNLMHLQDIQDFVAFNRICQTRLSYICFCSSIYL